MPFLEELTRAVVSGEGPVLRHARAELPETVLAMVQARLEGVDPELRRVLRAASVFGQIVLRGGVEALLGGPAGRSLAELVAAELVVRRVEAPSLEGGAGGGVEHAFRHALVRDAVYAPSPRGTRPGHRIAGAWLERQGKGSAIELAEHFERGDEPARGRRLLPPRRRRGPRRQRPRRGPLPRRAGRRLRCGWRGSRRPPARPGRGPRLARARSDRAAESAREALALLAEGSPCWFRAVGHGVASAGKRAEADRIAALTAAAQAATPAAGAASARALCLAACAAELVLAGRYDVADAVLAGVAACRRRYAGDRSPGARRRPPGSRVPRRVHRQFGATRAGFEASVAASESAGDRRGACNARSNLGFILAELGDFAEAEATLQAARAEAQRLGLAEIAARPSRTSGTRSSTPVGSTQPGAWRSGPPKPSAAWATPAWRAPRALTWPASTSPRATPVSAEREARAAAALLSAVPPQRAAALSVGARALGRLGRPADAVGLAEEAFVFLERCRRRPRRGRGPDPPRPRRGPRRRRPPLGGQGRPRRRPRAPARPRLRHPQSLGARPLPRPGPRQRRHPRRRAPGGERLRNRPGSGPRRPSSAEQRAALRAQVKADAAPRPGVYRMLADDGAVLYVGKSKRLRARLLGYFRCEGRERGRASSARPTASSGSTSPASSPPFSSELRLIKQPPAPLQRRQQARPQPLRLPPPRARAGRPSSPCTAGPAAAPPATAPTTAPSSARSWSPRPSASSPTPSASATAPTTFPCSTATSPSSSPSAAGPRAAFATRSRSASAPASPAARPASTTSASPWPAPSSRARGDGPIEHFRREMEALSRAQAYERAALYRDKLRRLERLQRPVRQMRFALESLSFVYPVPGFGGDNRVYLVRRGTVRAERPAPRSTPERFDLQRLVDEVFQAGEPAERAGAAARNRRILLLSSWFRRFPEELGRTWTPG